MDHAEEPRYLEFPHLPDSAMRDGKPALNKYSQALTRGHDCPGAQVRRFLQRIWNTHSQTSDRPCSTLPASLIDILWRLRRRSASHLSGGKVTRASKLDLPRGFEKLLTSLIVCIVSQSTHPSPTRFEIDHLPVLDLAKIVKGAVQKQGMLGWQYNTIGISDGITMGGEGRSPSPLPAA